MLRAEALEGRLLLAANSLLHNAWNPTDVDNDGSTTPSDAILIINQLNLRDQGTLGLAAEAEAAEQFLDVHHDQQLTPMDALAVINRLNGEGEDPNAVRFRLQATDLEGNPINQTSLDQNFMMNVFVQDVRGATATGVFSAYLDVAYDEALVDFNMRETQTLGLTGSPTGGTFRLTFQGQTTAAIPFAFSNLNPTGSNIVNAQNIEAALEALPNIGVGNVEVTPTPNPESIYNNRSYDVRFGGALANTDVSTMTPTDVQLTGGSNPAVEVNQTSGVNPASPADVLGSFTFGWPIYVNGRSGQLTTGTLDELGALSGSFSELGGDEFFLIRAEFRAESAGTANFVSNPADDPVLHPVLLYNDSPPPVPEDQIDFGTATVAIVQGVSAGNDVATVAEDSTNNLINVLSNDQALEGTLRLATVTTPNNGTATIDRSGTPNNFADDVIRYTPTGNFFGTDTFTYTVENGLGATATATVTVTVTGVNDPPTAGPDTATTAEDTALNINASQLLSNDSPGPNESSQTLSLTAVSATSSQGGTVSLSGGVITYTPANNFFGTDTFTYTVTDNGTTNGAADPRTATVTVTVTVTEVNDPPTAGPDTFAASEDTATVLSTSGLGAALLGNDTRGPANESNQTLTIITPPATGSAGGTITVSGQTVTYQPPSNFSGTETFTYTIQDNGTTNGAADPKQATGTITITVAAVNDPPQANDDQFDVDELSVDNALNVLANDTPGPGETGTIRITTVSTPPNGTASINNNGTPANFADDFISYTPDDDFIGLDTFTYTIEDSQGLTDTATVTVDVVPAVRPRARNDLVTIDEGTASAEIDVLANDLANEGAEPTLESFTQASSGTVTLDDNGTPADKTDDTLIYAPGANFSGTDTFTYTINDTSTVPDKQPSTATVTITVQAVNDAPVNAVPGTQTTTEDSSFVFSTAGGNAISISDVDAGTAEVETELAVNNGTLAVGSSTNVTVTGNNSATVTIRGTLSAINNALNGLTYTPNDDFAGNDTLTVTTNDLGNTGIPGPLTDTDTVTITVTAVNDPPVNEVPPPQTAIKDLTLTFSSAQGNAITVSDVDVGANDLQVTLTAPDGTLTLGSTSGVTVTGNGTGTVTVTGGVSAINNALEGLTFTPAAGFTGQSSLTVTTLDSGNTGSGGPQSTSTTIPLEVLDFVPSEISGFVYFDVDNDGVRDFTDTNLNNTRDGGEQFVELGIGGVEITLVGQDFRQTQVRRTTLTDQNGFYEFDNIAPGTYRVLQTDPHSSSDALHQPKYLLDGKDMTRVNGQPTEFGNDEYVVTIPVAGGMFNTVNGAPGSGVNFGERGVRPEFITLAETFASRTDIGLLAATDAPGNSYWFALLEGWDGATWAELTLSDDLSQATLTIRDQAGNEHSRILSREQNEFRIMGNDRHSDPAQRGYVVRVLIDFDSFMQQPTNGAGNGGLTSTAEAEAAAQLAAVVGQGGSDYAAAADQLFGADGWMSA